METNRKNWQIAMAILAKHGCPTIPYDVWVQRVTEAAIELSGE